MNRNLHFWCDLFIFRNVYRYSPVTMTWGNQLVCIGKITCVTGTVQGPYKQKIRLYLYKAILFIFIEIIHKWSPERFLRDSRNCCNNYSKYLFINIRTHVFNVSKVLIHLQMVTGGKTYTILRLHEFTFPSIIFNILIFMIQDVSQIFSLIK